MLCKHYNKNLRVFLLKKFVGMFSYIAEASTIGYGHGFFFFFTRNRSWTLALRAAVARVILHARALANAHYTCVNYELRKIVSEDDLHTQRAARKGIDVRRASLGSFMSRCREGNGGPLEKKGFVGHRLSLHAEIPALVCCA